MNLTIFGSLQANLRNQMFVEKSMTLLRSSYFLLMLFTMRCLYKPALSISCLQLLTRMLGEKNEEMRAKRRGGRKVTSPLPLPGLGLICTYLRILLFSEKEPQGRNAAVLFNHFVHRSEINLHIFSVTDKDYSF